MNLKGERVLITGGSSGIGFAIAEAMMARGSRIVITGRRPDVLNNAAERLRAAGGRIDCIAADVSPEKGRACLTEVSRRLDFVDELGQIDQRSVGREAGLNDQSTRPLCRVIHTIARQHLHSADKCIQADHSWLRPSPNGIAAEPRHEMLLVN